MKLIMPDQVILGSHAPGLGDWSLYTSILALIISAGKRVKISTAPTPPHKEAFRNDEIRQLLFEMNPYISGFTEELPNIPHLFTDLRYIKLAKQVGPIAAAETCYGFEPSGEVVPSIFYKPKMREDFKDVTVCDPSSVSQPMSGSVFRSFANWATRWHDLGPKFCILYSRYAKNRPDLHLSPDVREYEVRDIFEYADILASAKGTLMTEAGGHVLSAALRETGTFSCTTTMAFNDRLFVFPEDRVKYYITGQLTPDFHFYPQE